MVDVKVIFPKSFAVAVVLVLIFCQISLNHLGEKELGREPEKNYAEQLDSHSSPVYRGGGDSDILSGEIGRFAEQTVAGRVCDPDCPDGWEVDPYDLWQLNFDMVRTLIVGVDIGGGWLDDDGTDALLEYCIGELGGMWCYDETNWLGDTAANYVYTPMTENHDFIRISPNPSDGHDNVDYNLKVKIYLEDETEDDTTRSSFIDLYTKERNFAISGTICSWDNECGSSSEDPFDMFVVSLWPGEILDLNFNSYKTPHRGQMLVLITTISNGVLYTVQFWDDDTWTFRLEPDADINTYYVSIFTLDGDSYDDMSYYMYASLLWVNENRDPVPDYDGDGWTDHDELLCGTEYLLQFSVPYDFDGDKICDPVDTDDDGDGTPDIEDVFPFDFWEDSDYDGDLMGDNADPDDDNDLWLDLDEIACDTNPKNSFQIPDDYDNDHVCNILDTDDDNDGYSDEHELTECAVGPYSSFSNPLDVYSTPADMDSDLQCDALDSDRDNDNYVNSVDIFPDDPNDWVDNDADGVGDNTDMDDDNDGYSDETEIMCLTEPTDPTHQPQDSDGDGICDPIDTDRDGDGFDNLDDVFPDDSNEWTDFDNDGIGDNADTDDDNDGVRDSKDMFDLDPNYWGDYDEDGIPNEEDSDYDGNNWDDKLEGRINFTILAVIMILNAVIFFDRRKKNT